MIDSTPPRAWTSGRWWEFGALVGLRLQNRRIAASSVAPIRPGM